MGKRSRRKGARWEVECANRLEAATGVPCERNLEDAFGRGNSGDVKSRLPFAVQAKCGQRPNPWAAVKEAQAAAQPGEYAVALVRRNAVSSHERPEDVAVLPMGDFMDLLGLLKANGCFSGGAP